VFRKLQETIEHPCRSRERFALTEKAISTPYALGDQPEVLSNTLSRSHRGARSAGERHRYPLLPKNRCRLRYR
ncbi:hypothetical protein BGW80DRAFT_1289269, partial [Lactifluus volemus]